MDTLSSILVLRVSRVDFSQILGDYAAECEDNGQMGN